MGTGQLKGKTKLMKYVTTLVFAPALAAFYRGLECIARRAKQKIGLNWKYNPPNAKRQTDHLPAPRRLLQGDQHGRLRMPFWVHGRVSGEFIRRSLDTRKFHEAELKRDELLAGANNDKAPRANKLTNTAVFSDSSGFGGTLEVVYRAQLVRKGKLARKRPGPYHRIGAEFAVRAADAVVL
jgi:hypothetical protein